jgi:hypothetical protein
MLVAPAIGYWLDLSKGAYEPLFLGAATAYLLAFGIIQWLSPRSKTVS